MSMATIGPAPAAAFEDMTERGFNLWRHNPVTQAFLTFLGDQADNWLVGAGVLLEDGLLDPASPNENLNPHVIRGRVLAFRELQRITLPDIQRFYREATAGEET